MLLETLLKNILINTLVEEDKNELIEYIMNYHRISYVYTNQENLFGKRNK